MSDLDFLEDRATQWPGTEFSRDVLDLIQRLREASGWKDEALKLRTDALALDKRLREAEADLGLVAQERLNQEQHIRQLERGREAAQGRFEDWWTTEGCFLKTDMLDSEYAETIWRAALAAVEEPSHESK